MKWGQNIMVDAGSGAAEVRGTTKAGDQRKGDV